MASGLGATKFWSASVLAITRTWGPSNTTSITIAPRSTCWHSKDGGKSWTTENPGKQGVLVGTKGMRHGTLPPDVTEPEPGPCPGGVDFSHPDFALTCRMAGVHTGASRFYYSYDRGHTWKGPFLLPLFGQPGIAARTDYLVDGPRECTLFLTASKRNEREGRPICVRTSDGGKTWSLVSMIGPEPTGYGIMPSTVRLAPRNC